jgi:hypothetical protein
VQPARSFHAALNAVSLSVRRAMSSNDPLAVRGNGRERDPQDNTLTPQTGSHESCKCAVVCHVTLFIQLQLTMPMAAAGGQSNACVRRRSKKACGDCISQGLTTYDALIDDYIGNCRERARDESRWFGIQRSLGAAIENAGMARTRAGKRSSHQRRIPGAVLRAWTAELNACEQRLKMATTFEELHNIIESKARKLHGIGRLTAYDTARRLGAFLKLEPARVYLHAGTREGARLFGFANRDSIAPSDLPPSFRRLTAGEIEDCLCIYRDEIASIVRQ